MAIPELVKSKEYDCFIFNRRNYLGCELAKYPDYHYRLFKRYASYTGAMHEQLTGFKNAKVVDVDIIHAKSWAMQKAQDRRYAALKWKLQL